MVVFAEQSTRKKQVTGGASLVVVDGEEAQVVEALAILHDNLTGKVTRKEEQKTLTL